MVLVGFVRQLSLLRLTVDPRPRPRCSVIPIALIRSRRTATGRHRRSCSTTTRPPRRPSSRGSSAGWRSGVTSADAVVSSVDLLEELPEQRRHRAPIAPQRRLQLPGGRDRTAEKVWKCAVAALNASCVRSCMRVATPPTNTANTTQPQLVEPIAMVTFRARRAEVALTQPLSSMSRPRPRCRGKREQNRETKAASRSDGRPPLPEAVTQGRHAPPATLPLSLLLPQLRVPSPHPRRQQQCQELCNARYPHA